MGEVFRQSMDVDIVCVGFGPATGGFLQTLSKYLMNENGTPRLESRVMPGMPLQVLCYERADDIGFGVSGVSSKARAIKESFPGIGAKDIPMAAEVKEERLVYLLDPIGASRRSMGIRIIDTLIKMFRWLPFYRDYAFKSPIVPPFMDRRGGFVFSMGQFIQWVGAGLMASSPFQVWPGTPVCEPVMDGERVNGVRLMDQGTDLSGKPEANYMPGMDINADLTVVGDGPVGAVGGKLDKIFGLPQGSEQKDRAVGVRMLVKLRDSAGLEAGTVIHTVGFPEPEIFGFLYVHPENVASIGIFVPSWFDNPSRTSYRYLQHWMMHPYLWKYLEGGVLKSWGAKSLNESGKRGEPFLTGDGFARIGEGSGSTNVLQNSGVDEAWMTGVLLGEAVEELVREEKPFTGKNLKETYERRRKASWLESEARVALHSRDGFQAGVISGFVGTVISWLSRGKLFIPVRARATHERVPLAEKYFRGNPGAEEIQKIKERAYAKGLSIHDEIMNRLGWPEIPLDGKLLVSHQDALLVGGKVQAPGGYKDHVLFTDRELCRNCDNRLCIEICSGQAITPSPRGVPDFDREKCVHCGACLWNCTKALKGDPHRTNIDFQAGAGGLHSVEN